MIRTMILRYVGICTVMSDSETFDVLATLLGNLGETFPVAYARCLIAIEQSQVLCCFFSWRRARRDTHSTRVPVSIPLHDQGITRSVRNLRLVQGITSFLHESCHR